MMMKTLSSKLHGEQFVYQKPFSKLPSDNFTAQLHPRKNHEIFWLLYVTEVL